MADNKTKLYVAPLTFGTKDLIELQNQNKESFLTNAPEHIGIHEFVEEKYAKNDQYNKDLIKFAEKVSKIRERDFYIELIPVKDAMDDILWIQGIKYKLFDRKTCPTPTPGHHVHFFDSREQHISLLWVLPSQQYIDFVKYNIVEIYSDVRETIKNIQDYEDGTLLKIARTRNGEDLSTNENRVLKLKNISPQTDTRLKVKDERHNG